MKKDFAKIYLNEARLAEAKTWDDVDNLVNELKSYAQKEDCFGKMCYNYEEWTQHKAQAYDAIQRLITAWEVHYQASATLESMLDKTYGEIIDEDGDWYIKEERDELLKKEALENIDKIAKEAWDIGKDDEDEYI